MIARTPRNSGGEHADGRSPDRARPSGRGWPCERTRASAVVRVVVAVAEEEHVVVRRRRAMCASSAGLVGPSASSQASSSVTECGSSNTAKERRPKSSGIALARHREPAHRHAVDRLDARRQLVAPRDVVAGARRQHLHVVVSREMLRDVARVQLGAAVDVGAVTLDDDGELHWPVSESPGVGPAGRTLEPMVLSSDRDAGASADSPPWSGAPAGPSPGPRRRPRRRRRRLPGRPASPSDSPSASCSGPVASVTPAHHGPRLELHEALERRVRAARRSRAACDSDSTRIFRFFTSMPEARELDHDVVQDLVVRASSRGTARSAIELLARTAAAGTR